MKYISAEEFLKQPREVQEVFLDNINLEQGNLYKDTADLTVIESLDYINTNDEGTIYYSVKGNMSDYSTIVPLLTEGQLREFIEDKTSELAKVQCKVKIEYKTKDEIEESQYNSNLISLQSQEGYFIQITSTEFMGGIMKFSDLGTDLLKAYWQVACKIAYECSELKIKEELKALKHNIEVLENSIESCSEWEYYTEISDLLESDKERYNKLMKDYDFRENKIAKTLRVERMKNNGNKIYD